MSAYFTIQLNNLHFFAEHGMYEEERAVGNEFEMNISLQIKAPKEKIKSLEDTINYAEVYRMVKEIFSRRKPLLETLAMEIAEELKQQFSQTREINISIKKLNPPITGFSGSVGITYTKTFK
jgi:dihydroneopterin aldolase